VSCTTKLLFLLVYEIRVCFVVAVTKSVELFSAATEVAGTV
jgi:hypothetical protein